MPETAYPFSINNQYGQTLVIYSTMSQPVSSPPSMDADAYYPIYTNLGTVAANQTGSFSTSHVLARIVIARASDDFPLKLAIVEAGNPQSKSVTVTADDEKITDSAWTFYKSFMSQPYQPISLQFQELVLNTSAIQLNQQAASFFSANNYPGVDFGVFSMLSFWATNSLYAFPGTYWCYEPQSNFQQFILPTIPVGTIAIANGSATYFPTSGGSPTPLSFSRTKLTSAGATAQNGITLTGMVRDLTWEGKPDEIAMCFVGTNNGTQTIGQPYQNPSLPWYAVTYDLVYGAFFTMQLAMAIDMAATVLKTAGEGVQFLVDNATKLVDNIRQWTNDLGDSAGPDTAAGGDVDPVNVDIDVDIDVDVDVDIDVDVDVDVDIDVDVDVDFLAVVDVDVDIDIDIDIDVVTDVDVDVDVDIDTDVDVQAGMIRSMLNKLGNWIMDKALPTLLEGAVMYFAFQAISKILQTWKNADESGMQNLQPRESTGLGLLINYMFNEKKSMQERWNTFADYVQQSQADAPTIAVSISSLLMTSNTDADTASTNWRWSKDDVNAAVGAMSQYTGANTYQAFQTLGGYTYNGQALPVKVGAQVAMKYLKH